jgi:hypothetical protein
LQRSIFCHGNVTRAAARSVVAFPRALNGGRPKMAKFAPLNMSPEEIIEYTPEWDGERFADGRPRVPDDLLERMVRFHPAGRRAHRTDSLHCLPASQPPEPPSHRCS